MNMIVGTIDKEIADIAGRLSAAGNDTTALAELSAEFQEILTDMFAALPQFVEADDDLDFQGGEILVPISNETLLQIVDIHFLLLNSDVPYDEFVFTNALNELEQRANNCDAVAHEIVAHYDDLYYQYSK